MVAVCVEGGRDDATLCSDCYVLEEDLLLQTQPATTKSSKKWA